MSDLDLDRFLKILGMLGSSHDGERLAALGRATAMLKAAGKGWSDVVGKPGRSAPSADTALQTALNRERVALAVQKAAFEKEKAAWTTRMQQWQRMISKEQEERLAKQHQEDLARNRQQNGDWPNAYTAQQSTENISQQAPRYQKRYSYVGDQYRDWGDPDIDDQDPTAPDAPPRSAKWETFKAKYPQHAHWIIMNKDRKDFAASLHEWVKKTGFLTEGQRKAVKRWL